MPKDMPHVTITEQPADKSHRFRYQSEQERRRRSVRSILGVSSTSEHRTYPAIRVHGYKGPFVVLLSLLNPHNNLVHPNSICTVLNSENYKCRNGVLFIISDEPEVVFENLTILCTKKDDINKMLHSRKSINIDPFAAGFSHISDHRLIDFTAVRLCFQVILPGSDWTLADRSVFSKYTKSLVPVASNVVYDTKRHNDLKIVHITYSAGPQTGGTEMILLCDKYSGQIPVVVFENGLGWRQTVTPKMCHKQLAIVFLAPPYKEERDPRCPDYLKVQVSLQQSNERGGVFRSQPKTVEYLPFPPKGSPLQFPTLYPSCQPPPIATPPQISTICQDYVQETKMVSNFEMDDVELTVKATNANHSVAIPNVNAPRSAASLPSEDENMNVNKPAQDNILYKTCKTGEILSMYLDVISDTYEKHVNRSIDDVDYQIENISTDFNMLSV